MAIKEIWIPEALIVLFMALPLFRSFIKTLWPLDGLAWLPLVALGITVGIFPAYGFRLECIPMFIFALVYNIACLPSLIARRPDDFMYDQRPLRTALTLVLLGIVIVPMFVFSPQIHGNANTTAEPVAVTKIGNTVYSGSFAGNEYHLHVYGNIQTNLPLIFFVPPEMGSVVSIDLICRELQEKGYTVVTYSRKGYDTTRFDENGKKRISSPAKLLTYYRVFRKAAEHVSVNEQGKVLEAQRRADIEFLLPRLSSLLDNTLRNEFPPFILAGYGAGGSAIAYLAGENGFMTRHKNVAGVIAIESRLWSSYLPEQREPLFVPANAGIIRRHWIGIVERVRNLPAQRVSRTGPLPNAGLPVLYLVSSKALDSRKGQKSYQAVFDTIRSGSGPVAVTAIEDAGPMDYQDFPRTHPIYSFLFPGLKNTRKSENPVSDTVNIIGNYASFLLNETDQKIIVPPTQTIGGSLYVESKGLPQFRL